MKSVLFDMDGVLLDSEIIYLRLLQTFLKNKGISVSLEELRPQVGKRNLDANRDLIAQHHVAATPEEWLYEQKTTCGNLYKDAADLQLTDHVTDLLGELKRREIKTALVSSTFSRDIVIALNRFQILRYFDALIGGDMVAKPKPDPEGYLSAAAALHVPIADCLIIEDSVPGVQAGKNAGAQVIAYKGSTIKQDTPQADFTVYSFAELSANLDFYLNPPL